jgi:hypothetical protein
MPRQTVLDTRLKTQTHLKKATEVEGQTASSSLSPGTKHTPEAAGFASWLLVSEKHRLGAFPLNATCL